MTTNCVFREPLDNLLKLSATSLATKIRQKEVGAEEVTWAFVKRIKNINKQINAVARQRFEEALQEAREIDEMIQILTDEERENLAEIKPFLGVPFTAKEAFAIRGMPNCSGLVARQDFVAHEDAVVVRRLRQAGAIPIAVSNCSELCMWWESANRVYGRTCNPFDVTKIVGGSSGGEGALIGGGASVFGVGSGELHNPSSPLPPWEKGYPLQKASPPAAN